VTDSNFLPATESVHRPAKTSRTEDIVDAFMLELKKIDNSFLRNRFEGPFLLCE
jgi:hypothetical protein